MKDEGEVTVVGGVLHEDTGERLIMFKWTRPGHPDEYHIDYVSRGATGWSEE